MIGDPLPEGPSLSRAEVADLADGTPVIIVWSGGNGPHRYVIAHQHGEPVAATAWEVERDRLDSMKTLLGASGYVGQERYHTRVWLA